MRSFSCWFLVAVMAALPFEQLAGQQGAVAGRVTSLGGQSVSAAQVVIPGLDLGVVSQVNGDYRIDGVPAGTHTVAVQRIGFQRVEQQVTVVAGETVQVNFELTQQALQLDELVVTGTAGGTQRRAVGNAIERLDISDVLETRSVTSIEQVLSSGTPGMSIVGESGTVGGGTQIRLRASSSISLAGDPVIYIDGIRMNAERGEVGRHTSVSRLQDIDPRDIESIEVIKGPAAATLYGTEAANGVIQIITRRGVQGTAQFDVSLEVGANQLPMRYITQGWARNPEIPRGQHRTVQDLIRTDLYRLELARGNDLFQTAPMQRLNVALRGGTDLVRYNASFSRSDQEGITDWNSDLRTSARGSLDLVLNESFSIDLTGFYAESENNAAGDAFFGSNFGWGGRTGQALDPNAPLRGFSTAPDQFMRPDGTTDLLSTTRTTLSLRMTHQPREWVTHRVVLGVDDFRQERDLFSRQNDQLGLNFPVFRQGRRALWLTHAPVRSLDVSGTITLDVTPSINSASSYGLQYFNRQTSTVFADGRNFATPPLETVGAAAQTEAGQTYLENTTLGVFVQQQFGWENRVFLTGAVRMDDNSAFGDNFDAAVYPKLSGTWVLHEEDFWNVEQVSQLRLRAAWGAAGQQPDVLAASRLYEPVAGAGGQPALTPQVFGNPDLGPERGEELELGFDAEFLEGLFDVEFTGYWRKTKDALVERPLSPSLGFTARTLGSTQLVNLGEISAWGTETALNARILREGPVLWDLRLAFATQQNRVDDLGGVDRIPVQRGRSHVEGYPLASLMEFKVVSADFVSGDRGPVTNVMCDGGTGPDGLRMGGAPVPCADAPRVYWGTGEPTRLATLSSNWVLFDDWRVSMTVDYRGGHWMSSDYLGARVSGFESTPNAFLLDNPIGVAYFQRVARNGHTYHSAGFAKLRDISIGYSLAPALTERLRVSSARLNFGARNLATLWLAQSHVERERVIDPEMSRPDENFGGEAGGGWPPLRQFVLGMSVSF